MAKACGQPVEDMSSRRPDAQVYAHPGGTTELREFWRPRWAKRGDGSWAAVDTALRFEGGRVTPGNTVLPMWFSNGGDAPFATLADGDRQLALSWPGTLPAPVLDGNSATYPNVLTDVDLRVTAEPTGFTQVLVVKSLQAAAHPAVRNVRLGYATRGVSISQDAGGGAQARDPGGKVVFTSPQPTMWDSRGAAPGGAARTVLEVESVLPRITAMDQQIDATHITVIPDQAMLNDPATEYPVFVDPSWSGAKLGNLWKMVANRSDLVNSSTFTLNNGAIAGDAGAGRVCDNSNNGVCTSTQYLVRSMFDMDTSGIHGRRIISATFNITQKNSWTCNPGSNARLWLTGGISSSTTWNTQPAWESAWTMDAPASHKWDASTSCSGPGNVAFNVTALMQEAQRHPEWGGSATLGLRAIDEGTVSQWKRFDSTTASLSIVYNTPPNNPDNLSTHGQPCTEGSGRPVVAVTNPTLSARITDPDGAGEGDINGSLTGEFHWDRWNTTTGVWERIGSAVGPTQANGTTSPSPAPTFATGGIYRWLLRAANSWSYPNAGSGTDYTNWTRWCEFEVDAVRPNTPLITPDAANSPFVEGKTVRVTFRPGGSPADTDVTGYYWWVQDSAGTTAKVWQPGSTVTVDWTPKLGQGTIRVEVKDRIGVSVSSASYVFNAAQPTTEIGRWLLTDPAGSTNAVDSTGNGHHATVTLSAGSTLGASGRMVNGPTVLSADAGAVADVFAAGVGLDNTKSYTVAAWVYLSANTWNRSAVAMDGNRTFAFTLGVDYFAGTYRMTVCPLDVDNPSCPEARSVSAPRLNTWTHLVGSYDSATRRVSIYVNGVFEGSSTLDAAPFKASGPLVIGRLKWNGGVGDRWPGKLSDVRVWNRLLSATEIGKMVDPTNPANQATDLVGTWLVEPQRCTAGPPVVCEDYSAYAHDLRLTSGVSTTASGHSGYGLQAQGTGVVAETLDPNTFGPGPVLHTDQSFSVSAWVRLDDDDPSTPALDLPTAARTVLGQSGQKVSGFYLGVRQVNGTSRWCFAIPEADIDAGEDPNTTAPWYNIFSPTALTTSDIGQWHHLVATYDANKWAMRLYLDGIEIASGTRPNASFATTGPLTIGSALWTAAGGTPDLIDDWRGGIDTVYVYQGVVPTGSIGNIP